MMKNSILSPTFFILIFLCIGCKHDSLTNELLETDWDKCFKNTIFPKSNKSTYFIEGNLDNEHILISDKIDGFKISNGCINPSINRNLSIIQNDSISIYGNTGVIISKEFGINLNMPVTYIPFDKIYNRKFGNDNLIDKTLSSLKVGDLRLGDPYDGSSFAITINSKGCYTDNSSYPKWFTASSANGAQSGSYLRLLKITKSPNNSIYKDIYSVPMADYELELEFKVNLYKDFEGNQLWKKFTNGKMKVVVSFYEY
jgi:hypothetical protein